MGNKNSSIPIKEKELEKKREEILNSPSLPDLYALLYQNQNRASFGITTIAGNNNLIPRVVVTNIIVYAFTADMERDHQREQGQRQRRVNPHSGTNNNSEHGMRPETNNNMELHTVAEKGSLGDAKTVVGRNKELLSHKEPKGGSLPLHVATSHGHKEVATYLASEYPKGSYALDHADKSPLYLAVEYNHLDLAEKMLRLLVGDSEARSALKKGKSIIHSSIRNKNKGMLGMILRHQPDLIKHKDEKGLTPLSYAAEKGFADIVEFIIENYPKSINHKNADRSLPIHKACLGGHVAVLDKFPSNSLLERDCQSRTILHLAAKERSKKLEDVVVYLLKKQEGKQMIKLMDANSETPLDLAKNAKNVVVTGLIEKEDPKGKTKKIRT